MSKFKKVLALALSACMSLSLLAGCGGEKSPSASGAPAGNGGSDGAAGRVYWLNFKPELDAAAQELAATYTQKTGVPVQVVTAASGTYNQTLIAEMDKSEAPTLFVIGNQAGVKEWKDYALDLTGSAIANELNTDAYNLYDENGKLVSIGYCYECYGIIVNPDLVEKAGHSMDEITNFDGLKKVAEDIHANAATLGFDAFSSSDMDGSSSWRFTGHMANLEYYYEQEGQVWTECPPTLTGKYMDNFKNLYDLCINNSLTDPKELATGGHDAEAEFKDGKAAFFVNGSWEYAAVKDAVPNATMIPYYCGVAGEEKAGLNCGTENCWAINANVSEADQKATMDFMVWLVSDPDAAGRMVAELGVLPYKNAPESTNGFLAAAALNQYNADQSDANWEQVRIAFVDGWAAQYQAVNG